jgi:hypothetical protein
LIDGLAKINGAKKSQRGKKGGNRRRVTQYEQAITPEGYLRIVLSS